MEASAHSLKRETPAWFDEAKLGIFIHWNAASIPAFAPVWDIGPEPDDDARMWRRLPWAEAYQNTMNVAGSATARYHAEHFGDLPYDAFVERFRDELIPGWDPEPWADLFARAGARYVVLTTRQDDGFLLWPSAHPNPNKERWQSERDVVGDLAAAVRARGLRFGAYYCGGMDWTFAGLPITDRESFLAAVPRGAEYRAYVDAHWRELIERYQPAVLWNDYAFPEGADPEALFRYYLERVPDGVINDRFEPDLYAHEGQLTVYHDFLTPEYSVEGSPEHKWEACRGLGTSFGYNRQESDASYMSSTDLIHMFADIVARGGNLLINVGPTATGEIPWLQAERLLALGWWLQVNGDAIYGTRPWERSSGITGESIDVRYTASRDAVHAIVLGNPVSSGVDIDVRLDSRATVSLAGWRGQLDWKSSAAGVHVQLPLERDDQPAFSLRLSPPAAVRVFDEA